MHLEPKKSLNVILFGSSGVGKSSIVNMLSHTESVARVSSGAESCTLESEPYDVDIFGLPITLWDTVGLNEGEESLVPRADTIVKLYKLLLDLKSKGGVSLLLLVMRAPRIKTSTPVNWKLFREIICQGKVPAAIIITGLEGEENMEQWWWDHKGSFERSGIKTSTIAGVACVTACRGRTKRNGERVYDELYEKSQDEIRRVIRSTVLDDPIPVEPLKWFTEIAKTVKEWSWCPLGYQDVDSFIVDDSKALKELKSLPGFSEDFVQELRRKMESLGS